MDPLTKALRISEKAIEVAAIFTDVGWKLPEPVRSILDEQAWKWMVKSEEAYAAAADYL